MVDLWTLFLYVGVPPLLYFLGAGAFPRTALALSIALYPAFVASGVPLWFPYGVLVVAVFLNDLMKLLESVTATQIVLTLEPAPDNEEREERRGVV